MRAGPVGPALCCLHGYPAAEAATAGDLAVWRPETRPEAPQDPKVGVSMQTDSVLSFRRPSGWHRSLSVCITGLRRLALASGAFCYAAASSVPVRAPYCPLFTLRILLLFARRKSVLRTRWRSFVPSSLPISCASKVLSL